MYLEGMKMHAEVLSKEEIQQQVVKQREYCNHLRADMKRMSDFIDEYENVLDKIDSGEMGFEEGCDWVDNNNPESELDFIELC